MDLTSIQLLQGAAGAAGGKTYLDDVFSTYLYKGTGSGQTFNNSVDLTKGGLVWFKGRSSGKDHKLSDTVRGVNSQLMTQANSAATTNTDVITSFNNDGFTIGANGEINQNNVTHSSWTFRKAPGFFDIVTYTGTGSTQQIEHNLGSIPGCYMIKSVSNGGSWMVYHRQVNSAAGTASTSAANYRLQLDGTSNAQDDNVFGDTAPTATHFTAGSSHAETNQSGRTYVCYLFAGGESSAATATSCNFLGASSDAQDNKIWVGNASDKTSDFVYGTGDFTWEAWFNPVDSSNAYKRIIHHGHEWNQNNTVALMWDHTSYNNTLTFWSYALNSSNPILTSKPYAFQGSWNHVAVTRSGGTFRLFVNGVLESTNTSYSGNSVDGSETSNYVTIGATHNLNQQECFRGNISNVRIVKGTAVYTSSFRPTYEPLTNITNTKLLCCNGSSTTSATVTPKTLVSDSTVTINTTNSPFDDPEGFKFGEEENENLIKIGSYIGFGGGGSGSHVDVDLGWEPQWVLIKNSSATSGWNMFDSMRGTPTGLYTEQLSANSNAAENNYSVNQLDFTSTGFRVNIEGNSEMNQADSTHVYIAIRRLDPLVQKPAEAGTDVFAMDTGSSSSYIPNYDSGFPVGFAFYRQPNGSYDWYAGSRQTGYKYYFLNTGAAEQTYDKIVWDSNVGWSKDEHGSYIQSWMWKRHAGFDVVAYKSPGGNNFAVKHNLGKVPEMMWIKRRFGTNNWTVYHKGLNGGTNPQNYGLHLNTTAAKVDDYGFFADIAPNATTFQVGYDATTGSSGESYLALLFASVTGISKVGYFTGTGSNLAISLGFQPRFLIIKSESTSGNWNVLDTPRGWTSGADNVLELQATGAQQSIDVAEPTSTGFTLTSTQNNVSGTKYIYYAHA